MSTIWAIGASVRAMAQALAARGHQIVAADIFNDLDLQQVAQRIQRIVDYPRDLLRLVDEVEADAFVYTGGLENEPDLIDELATKVPLMGNPGHVLKCVRDVFRLRDALARGGFRMPPMARDLSVARSTRWLRKAVNSSGGLRVAWATSQQKGSDHNEYGQAFISGAVYGASFHNSADGIKLLGIARQLNDCPWTQAPRFHYAGSIGRIYVPDRLQQEITMLGHFLVNEFNLQGWFGVDLVVDRQQNPYVLEVNPRYTASMELFERSGSGVVAKAILYAGRMVSVTTEVSERLLQHGDIADIPSPGSTIAARSPVCTLFARGTTEPLVLAELQAKTQDVSAELARLATLDTAHS